MEHVVEKPRFPVIDYHNHLDAQDPGEMLRIMDECGVEKIVNITMLTGDAAIDSIRKYHTADKDRFATIGWMDWSGVEGDDFVAVTLDRLERLIEHGACGIKFWKDFGLTVKDAEGKLLRIDDERFAPIFEKAADWKLPVMFHTADPAAFFRPIDAANERYEELAAHPEWGFQRESSRRSASCWSSGMLCSDGIRERRSLGRMWGRVVRTWHSSSKMLDSVSECMCRYELANAGAWTATVYGTRVLSALPGPDRVWN